MCINNILEMKEQDSVVELATVLKAFPNAKFDVQLNNGHIVRADICGKMKRSRFRFIPGDKVKVEISFYDLNKGRIVQRLNPDFSEIPIIKKQSFKKGSARRRKQ